MSRRRSAYTGNGTEPAKTGGVATQDKLGMAPGEQDTLSGIQNWSRKDRAVLQDRRTLLSRALHRPEATALAGTIAVFVFFAIMAGNNGFLSKSGALNYLEVSSEIGIIAVPAALLLIAGEFDLSVGSTMGACGVAFAYPIVYLGWPMWGGIACALIVAILIGLVNGILVAKTPVPSFIVTLSMMFIVEGIATALTQQWTGGTQIGNISEAVAHAPLVWLFNGQVDGFSAEIFWWVAVTAIGAWVLDRTRSGNWIYAVGGNRQAAQKIGIPVQRVQIMLYIFTAVAAAIVGILVTLSVNVADVASGGDMEFQVAAAAVIGGTLITGGFGSPIGTFLGSLLFGIANEGFYYTNLSDTWFEAFIGVMLLAAVLINLYTRKASLMRRPGRRRSA